MSKSDFGGTAEKRYYECEFHEWKEGDYHELSINYVEHYFSRARTPTSPT